MKVISSLGYFLIQKKLNQELYKELCEKFGNSNIDLFASYINKQLNQSVSWYPKAGAVALDASSLTWNNIYFYMLAPFSFVGQTLAKITWDGTKAVPVVPDFFTQFWHPQLLLMTMEEPCMSVLRKRLTQARRNPHLSKTSDWW